MTTLREAAQRALEALLKSHTCPLLPDDCAEAITDLRAALAEPVQEPVAWMSRDDARLALWEAINKREFGNPTDDKLILDHLHQQGLWIGKYTAPPQRKPLTDEEIIDAVRDADLDWAMGWTLDETQGNRFATLARAIERAHGIGGDA